LKGGDFPWVIFLQRHKQGFETVSLASSVSLFSASADDSLAFGEGTENFPLASGHWVTDIFFLAVVAPVVLRPFGDSPSRVPDNSCVSRCDPVLILGPEHRHPVKDAL
jgi:hypothetical protein